MKKIFSQKSVYTKIIIILLMASIYFFSYFQRTAIPGTLFNELQSDFAASASEVSMLGAIGFYIYASMHFLTGSMVDRFGAGRILLIGGSIMVLGSLLFPISHSIRMLYFSRAWFAFGASLIYVSMVKEIDDLFDQQHFAMVLSTALFVGCTGGLFGTYPLERLIVLIGWRQSFLATGFVSILALLLTGLVLYRCHRLRAGNGGFSWVTIKNVITNRAAMPMVFTSSVCLALYFLMQATIGKKMLQDCFSFTSASAATFTFAMMLINIAGVTTSGFASRMMQNKRKPMLVLAALLTVIWTSFILLILIDIAPQNWLFMCYLLSAFSASFSPIFCSAIKETNHPDSAGTSTGLSNGVSYLFVAIAINFAGVVLDLFKSEAAITSNVVIYPRKAYAVIFVGCSIIALLSFISSLIIRESNGNCVSRSNWNSRFNSNLELVK